MPVRKFKAGTKEEGRLRDSFADPHDFDEDPDPACHFDAVPDPDPTFHFDSYANPDPDPGFQIKAQKTLKNAQIGSYSIHFGLSSAN